MIQGIEPRISQIREMPMVNDKVHESIFKSSASLNYIMDMVRRGDSKETIIDVFMEIYQPPRP